MIRFELVDYLHLVYKTIAAPPLSCTLYVDGERRVVDTAIPSFTCKDIWRFSGSGKYNTGVFLEGGAPMRKAYFDGVKNFKDCYLAKKAGIEYTPTPKTDKDGYKAGRSGLNSIQKMGVNLTVDCLVKGQVSAYQVAGFEADDLIWTAYKQIREAYPDAHIDIFTGDMDMLPLVDEHTSVYMRGNRTWAAPLCGQGYCQNCKESCASYDDDTCKIRREFKNYFEVTPENWDEFIGYRSAFKGFNIPYNAVFLFKMLRGDTSDNVPMVEKGWGGKKWNGVIEKMIADGVDFANLFRYDTPWLDVGPVLRNYFSEETVAFMQLNAEGIRPRSSLAELINMVPCIGDQTSIDVQEVYNLLSTGQQYVPTTTGQHTKAMLVYDCITHGINPTADLKLTIPTTPDLGYFQTALNPLKINLKTTQSLY